MYYIQILAAKHAMCPHSCRHGLLGNKKVHYRLRSLRTPHLFDGMKNCIERVELSFGFAVMVFVFAGSLFSSRYLRLNKDACQPSYLPCPLFVYQYRKPPISPPKYKPPPQI